MKILLFKKREAWNIPLKVRYLNEIGADFHLYTYDEEASSYRLSQFDNHYDYSSRDFISLTYRGETFPESNPNPLEYADVFNPSLDRMRIDRTLIRIVEESEILSQLIRVYRAHMGADFDIEVNSDGVEYPNLV